jgi:hypothetical protein
MKTMSEITGHTLTEFPMAPDKNRPHPSCSVGIEVEVEGFKEVSSSAMRRLSLWKLVKDGSLRNGCEFVSQPVWGTGIADALDQLAKQFDAKKPISSLRTSVHVHLNVLDLSYIEVERLLKISVLYEPALFRMHDKWQRYENIFCVPTCKSSAIQDGYTQLLYDLREDRISGPYVPSKYAAVNPNSIAEIGTIEFRHMGGTSDVKEILSWIDVILQMKVAASSGVNYTDPQEVFGEQYGKLDIHEEDIQRGLDVVQYINMRN